jgi:outer membrane protein OmpA-like peptidoglycan-associated protein/tetratricopeptide (TPR) repeat protein
MNTILSKPINNKNPYKFVKSIFFLLIGCSILSQAQSQVDKRLEQADQFFAAGEYFTAAGLYGQFLNPANKFKSSSDFPLNSKRNTQGKMGKGENANSILFKQAESYRLSNYWSEAANLYKICFEKEPAKYASALYLYAVCQRSIGNYQAAEESLDRFLNEHANENSYQQAALNEKQTLQFIKSQLVRPDTILYQVRKINTSFGNDKGVFAPVATSANAMMITSTQTDSVASGINPYHNRLFNALLSNEGLQITDQVVIEGNDALQNQGAASVSSNGNHMYFTQWKKENGKVISAIYLSKKADNGWSQPLFLSSVNQPGYSSKQPFISADGKYLYFASDRSGGSGNFDIWFAPINEDGTTGEPVNAGNILNSASNEQAPFYHNSTGTLVFASDRMPGMGGFDLFTAKGDQTFWKQPENLGHPVNSSRDDVYFFTADKTTVLNNAIVSSDRGSECCLATFAVSKANKKKRLTGVIRDCKDDQAVADAIIVMKDASGKDVTVTTNADGQYTFELTGASSQQQLFINKEKYNEKISDVTIAGSNESNWQTDTLYNASLCIEKKLVIKVENVVTVYFDFDQSLIKERGIAQLDSIFNVLMEDTLATIQISGYTDGRGTVEYNKILSDKRAKACADYLIAKGIDAGRISFESFGACCPVEMELLNGRDNPDGRSMNRRALINISKE